ncbi:unnamed protein product, partial [Ostreobium quekettii]
MLSGATGLVTDNRGMRMPSWVMGTAPHVGQPCPPNHLLAHARERERAAATDGQQWGGTEFNEIDGYGSEHKVGGSEFGHGFGPGCEPGFAPGFGPDALRSLSLALGVRGLELSVLVLDHNLVGDEGMSALAAGLRRCASLKRLSLAHCGLRELAPKLLGPIVAGEGAPGDGELRPKLESLNLQGNPLAAQGLVNLCE